MIALIAALIVVVVVIIGMVWLSGRSAQEGKDAAATCVNGDMQVHVAVAPALVEPLSRIAASFNESGAVSADYCPKVEITGIESPVALSALSGEWDAKLGKPPALWIPESTTWTARLAAAKPAELSGQPTSIASSPVVLAVRTSARESFEGVRWLDLPARQGDLKIALPTEAGSDGTYLAAQSVAAAVARTEGAAISDDAARSPLVTGTLGRWVAGAPGSTSAVAALDSLTTPGDIRAVPVTEQQLYGHFRGRTEGAPIAVYPMGPTAAATYPAAVLDRTGITDAQQRGAADFVAYAGDSEHSKPLADAGFRVSGAPAPARTDSIAFGTVEPLAIAPNAAAVAIADAVTPR